MKILCLIILVVICETSSAFRWCCKSNAEFRKCEAFSSRVDPSGNHIFKFDCVEADSTAACVDMIRDGSAEVIDLDGGDIFLHKDDITVVAAEDSGEGDASYYAVAVVKATARPDLNLYNLAGATTCHTGVGKTSGWNMPLGWMLRQGADPTTFAASCAPGADSDEYRRHLPDGNPAKWCMLCIGDNQRIRRHKCERDNDELYYGYKGAFRCMKDNAGEIAFIKHATVLEAEDIDAYELLCPEKPYRRHPSQWRNCSIGRVPSHAVVMNKLVTEEDATHVFEVLNTAQQTFNDFTTYGGKNLLWGSKTTRFLKRERMHPVTFLGMDYYCNTYALQHGRAAPNC